MKTAVFCFSLFISIFESINLFEPILIFLPEIFAVIPNPFSSLNRLFCSMDGLNAAPEILSEFYPL